MNCPRGSFLSQPVNRQTNRFNRLPDFQRRCEDAWILRLSRSRHTRRRHFEWAAVEIRSQQKQVLLAEVVDGGVMTTGALEVDGREGFHRGVRPHRHRNIIPGRQRKAGRSVRSGVARVTLHPQQFGDEPIEGFVLPKRIVQPLAERARVVQRRENDRRILGQHILPVTDPAVGPLR